MWIAGGLQIARCRKYRCHINQLITATSLHWQQSVVRDTIRLARLVGQANVFMRYVHTLSFRVLVGSCLLLITLFGFYTYLSVRFHNRQMEAQVFEAAYRMSDLIKKSTRYSMLLNRREDVYQIIKTVGSEPGVTGIRIYTKRGVIVFSTNSSEEMKVVDMQTEACIACHDSAQPLQSLASGKRTRVYIGPNGYRILGLINPIRNEPSCSNAACHAHPADRTMLGVLDVRMSLEKVDADIASTQRKLIYYAIGVTTLLALSSGLFLFFTVHRPVQKLMEGTKQISSGNLDYHLPIVSSSEIGELAREFNEMTGSLRKAEDENRTWSRTLEKRVEEKTAELKQIHQQILQIEKMASLGKLSATVAHELNNPLEGILTYSKLIARRLRKNENRDEAAAKMLEDMDLIIREVQRCGNIVKNLLLFSKKQVGEFALIPIQSIIDKATQLMHHHFKILNVSFETRVAEPDATLMCDENQIQQALVALFVNAVEAMPEGGALRLESSRRPSGDLEIRLEDTGSGIAAEDLPHVFEPFFTTKKGGKGIGLGLSIVYGIIERHGGSISAQSGPDKGTAFIITFPPPAKKQQRTEVGGTGAPQPA